MKIHSFLITAGTYVLMQFGCVQMVWAGGNQYEGQAFQEHITGFPLITSFTRSEYQGQPQNWAIVQHENGLLYVGNGDGVLEFDGVNWNKILLQNNTTARSLAIDENQTIYVGGVGEFGYLKPDKTGKLYYHNLSDDLPDFADLWNIIADGNTIYFSTREALFRYRNGEIKYWQAKDTRFHRTYLINGELYVHCERLGLLSLNGDELTYVAGSEQFRGQSRLSILKYDEQTMLIAHWDRGLYTFDGSVVSALKTQADHFFTGNPIYNATVLVDGNFAFSVLGLGIVIIDMQGRLLYQIDRDSGLHNEYVLYPFVDNYGSLWLALNDGINRLETGSPFTMIDDRSGLSGGVLSAKFYDGALFAGTASGVFTLDIEKGQTQGFMHLRGVANQVWDFMELDDGLYAVSNSGVYRYNGDAMESVVELIGISMHKSAKSDDFVFVGLSDGVGYLKSTQNGYRYQTLDTEVNAEVRNIMELDEGVLWISTLFQGLFRLEYEISSHSNEINIILSQKFGLGDGLPGNSGILIIEYKGRIYFSTPEGFYDFDAETKQFFPIAAPFKGYPDGRELSIFEVADDGTLWVISDSNVMRGIPDGSGNYNWSDQPFSRINQFQPLSAIVPLEGGSAILGSADGLLIYDETKKVEYDRPYQVLFREIRVDGVSKPFAANQEVMVLEYPIRSVNFHFAAPGQLQKAPTLFRFRLHGYLEEWSDWSSTSFREFNNLNPGSYTFEVQARDMYDTISQASTFSFVISTPWYQTIWAYLFYLALLVGLTYSIVKWRVYLLEKKNYELEQKVKGRTAELFEEKQKLQDANKVKTKLLRIVAHDLKNPLGIIVGYSDAMLKDENLPIAETENISVINKNAEKMLHSIVDLLDSNSTNQTELTLQMDKLNLADIIQEVVASNEFNLKKKNQKIEMAFWDESFMIGDYYRVYDIVDNLLSNAIKFSPLQSQIHVSTTSVDKEWLRFTIKDSGPGFTEEDKLKIFEKFQKLSAKPTANETSSGLGLSIVKELVDLHGGKITLDETDGKGAVFHMDFRKSVG